jgi:GDPmannose 4,6-dehydratase
MAAARIKLGLQDKIYLGNLNAIRDWGYAKEYVESMWLMLQQDNADDYVVATGIGASVRDFAQASFDHVGLDYTKYVVHDLKYERATEVDALIGDGSKIKNKTGWKPLTTWKELSKIMVDSDLEMFTKQLPR